MPLLPPRAFPANSVMTQRWADRVTLSGDLTQAGHTHTHLCKLRPLSSSSKSSASTQPLPRLQSSTVKTVALSGFTPRVIIQVRKLPGRCLLAFLLVLVLVCRPAMGKPWYNEKGHQVTFQSRLCQPLSVEHLQRLMGPAFDDKKMAPDMETAKRMFGADFAESGTAGYQGDDPRVARVLDNTELVEDEEEWDSDEEEETWINEREEEIYMEDGMLDRVEEEDEVMERRIRLPRRKTLSRDLSKGHSSRNPKYSKYGLNGEDRRRHGKGDDFESDSYAYMKRRRRRSPELTGKHRGSYARGRDELIPDDVVEDEEDEEDGDVNINDDDYDDVDDDSSDSKDKKSTDSILPLRLILSGKNKKLRRKLKTKFRQKTKFLKKSPPWECKMTVTHMLMGDGFFPRSLSTGECKSQTKCFYRLYECVPEKYNIKVLERDPDHCNPLPNLGNSTIYEERWNFKDVHVIVGCNCAKVRQKKRRRD